MIKGGGRLCLLNETAEKGLVLGKFFVEELDRDLAIELCVAGKKNVAHTARADRRDYFVLGE